MHLSSTYKCIENDITKHKGMKLDASETILIHDMASPCEYKGNANSLGEKSQFIVLLFDHGSRGKPEGIFKGVCFNLA